MFIPLAALSVADPRTLHVNNKSRLATATAVRLLGPDRLICSSLLDKRMYLIRFDLDTQHHEVIHTLTTSYNGEPTETDLCDYDHDGHIITSNCRNSSASLYHTDGATIRFVRDLPLNIHHSFTHGIKFLGSGILAVATVREPVGVHFFDLRTLEPLYYLQQENRSKDMCFLGNNEMILLNSGVGSFRGNDPIASTQISHIRFDLENKTHHLLREVTIPDWHSDSIVRHDDWLFINNQDHDKVAQISLETLELAKEHENYNFPHGVDIEHGILAVSNYGSNGIDLRRL